MNERGRKGDGLHAGIHKINGASRLECGDYAEEKTDARHSIFRNGKGRNGMIKES